MCWFKSGTRFAGAAQQNQTSVFCQRVTKKLGNIKNDRVVILPAGLVKSTHASDLINCRTCFFRARDFFEYCPCLGMGPVDFPPCIRHLPFGMAGLRQKPSDRLHFAPHLGCKARAARASFMRLLLFFICRPPHFR